MAKPKETVETPAPVTRDAELVPVGEVAAIYVNPDTLVEWAKNPRQNQEAILAVAKSIRRFGFGAPIVARAANREIITGHSRFRAAKLLKLDRVPVRFMDISEDDAHKLAIADNKIGEIATWDDDSLEDQMLQMSLEESRLLGFAAKELAAFGAGDEPNHKKKKAIGGLEYKLVVKCADELAQADLMNRLELEGYEVSPMIT